MKINAIIIRFGEMSTKGKNKKDFIFALARSIKRKLADKLDKLEIRISYDHIYIYFKEDNIDITDELKNIPGMYSFSLCYFENNNFDIENLKDIALNSIKEEKGNTFKIRTKRNDKSYPYLSDEINREIAGHILRNTNLKVDVHNPEILLSLEIHSEGIYFFYQTIKGMGGYPASSIGRCLMMLSGGIDSPVASYLLMKRGIELTFIHYASPPYTNIGVIEKIKDLANELLPYQNKIRIYVIPFTKLQEEIYKYSFEGYPITILRRMMYRIAENLARKLHIPAIANGESVGQVASQTLDSINTINNVTCYPIIRPLATMDKVDIINISKKINTFDISIRPYEDCCTIFEVKKPKTQPHIEDCIKIESKFDYESLIEDCVNDAEVIEIKAKL